MTGKRIFLVASFAIAIAILVVVITRVDLKATLHQLARVGVTGTAVVLLDMTIALLGPMLAWHILMRSEGIHIRLSATLASGLMGHAANLISPMMYFGGEGIRTLHIARVTGTPRRRVLATVVAGEFQQLTALSATIIASLIIVVVGSSTSPDMPISWMIAAAASLATVVVLILCVVLLDLRLLARAIGLLMRCGFFPGRLALLREAVADTEEVVRGLLVRHKLSFLASQLVIFLSPLAQFVLPAIFFWFLRAAGENVQQPSLAQLASFFVLVQLLFMIPLTPAGLGFYEGGIIGIFQLHGWGIPNGAAYAILIRLDDVLFSILGVVFLMRFGLMHLLRKEEHSHA